MSLTNEQQQDNLAKVKLAVDSAFSAQVEVTRALGASDDALKMMDNTFKLKGGALGIAQVALATKQEGAAGGIDAAISWGVGTVTGIGIVIVSTLSAPVTAALVIVGGGLTSFGYDNTISDTVKSTLNNWFSDTPEQKQQQFNTVVDGASDDFKQAFEVESGQTLEQIKQQTDFNTNANAPENKPDWVDDALEPQQNPLNKFQDQLDAAANNPELKDSVEQVKNKFKDKTTTNEDIPSYDQWFNEKYTEWFDTEFSQWFDTNYETYLNEQYDDYLDEQYSSKQSEWSNEKYTEWYSEQHWELHDEKYDEWQDEKYFDWYYEQYYELNDEKYTQWYSEKHWELYDEKYDQWHDKNQIQFLQAA